MIRREDPIAKWIWWSCMAHAGLMAAFIAKEAIVPSTPKLIPPTLRVDLVGLPDIMKKDLSRMAPPPVAKEEPKKEPVAPPPAPEVEVTKPDEMVLKPKQKVQEPPKSSEVAEKPKKEAPKEKDREKKLSNALARIRSLERLKNEQNAAEESAVIKGNQISRGSSLSGEARESSEAGYYDLVREALNSNWSIPPWLARQKYSAQVQIKIDGDGRITGMRFMKPSGNDQFDDEVRNTLKVSQPFPKPPAEIASTVAGQGILVGFPL